MKTLKMRALLYSAFFLLGSYFATAKDKPHNWMTGVALDTDRSRILFGVYNNTSTYGNVNTSATQVGNTGWASGSYNGHSSSSSTALYKVYENYVIQSNEFVYLTEERLRFRWSKPAHIIVNSPIQFAVEGNKLFLLDADGSEHETHIVKQARRQVQSVQPNQEVTTTVTPLINGDILKLKNASLSDEVIVRKISTSPGNYKLDPDELIRLKQAGVSDLLINAMFDASKH